MIVGKELRACVKSAHMERIVGSYGNYFRRRATVCVAGADERERYASIELDEKQYREARLAYDEDRTLLLCGNYEELGRDKCRISHITKATALDK